MYSRSQADRPGVREATFHDRDSEYMPLTDGGRRTTDAGERGASTPDLLGPVKRP
jgi:hypothetical protein